MNLQVRNFGRRSWSFVLITKPGRWWGICHAGSSTCLDLGKWRFSRRNDWTPLFTTVHHFGPIQWWTSRTWTEEA